MKALFFGFSVTEDAMGYRAKLSANPLFSSHEISFLGIGGIQPNHANFLLSDIIKAAAFDIVILEIGTAAFRKWLLPKKYLSALLSMISAILKTGAMPVILDLPRRDVDPKHDWVRGVHRSTCDLLKIPHLDIADILQKDGRNQSDYLRDDVHTNQLGAEYYSEKIAQNLELWISEEYTTFINSGQICNFQNYSFASAISFNDLTSISNPKAGIFSRGGLSSTYIALKPDDDLIHLTIDDHRCLSGLSYLMGPTSGTLEISRADGNHTLAVSCYDEHCYYERMGAIEFEPIHCTKISVKQLSKMPETKLLKGTPNVGEREGKIFSAFFSNETLKSELECSEQFASILRASTTLASK